MIYYERDPLCHYHKNTASLITSSPLSTNMKQTMKTLLIITLLAILAIAITGIIKFNILNDDIYIYQPDGSVVREIDRETYNFTTENGISGVLTYTSRDKDTASLDINGNFYQLKRAVSGSGARYTNEDASVVFWEHQGEATITINEETLVTTSLEKVEDASNMFTDKNNMIYFDAKEKAWKDNYGICHTCTPENGFGENGEMLDENIPTEIPAHTLAGTTWEWIETGYSNDEIITPADSGMFTVTFSNDMSFSSTTDCNTIGGSYTTNETNIDFGPLFATKKACLEETLETTYANMFGEVSSYMITEDGRLVLMLKYDTGSMIFNPAE